MASRRDSARAVLCAILLTCLLAVIGTPTPGREVEPAAIPWHSDYATALEEARTTGRLVWLQFTGPWCPNCARMEQDSFPDPAVREHAQRSFVPLKLRSDQHEELALSLELTGLPATVIIAPSREVVAVRQGYLGPRELDELLDGILSRRHSGLEESRKLAAAADDGQRGPRKDGGGPGRGPRTRKETQLALSGFCPVSLVSDKRLVPGQTEYTITHQGRLYRLASLLTLNLFRREPERFIPVNNGNCPVAQVDRASKQPGDPHYGVLYQGRLYLCASAPDRTRFLEEPDRYAAVDVAEQGYCPHCLTESGSRVRGNPRIDLTRDGRRYWFPDPSHRQAFLTAAAGRPNAAATR